MPERQVAGICVLGCVLCSHSKRKLGACLTAQVRQKEFLDMDIPAKNDKRIKPRLSVTLKATVNFGGQAQDYQSLISNLSATGARLHLEQAAPLKIGTSVGLKVFVPDTVLHLDVAGEVFWVRRQHAAVSLGVRFNEPISEFMMQRLIER
jgi:Tfp pilus assembly protein PilZ